MPVRTTSTGLSRSLAIGALVLATATPVAVGQAAELESFEGRYRFAGGQRERERLRSTIDEVVDQLDFFMRPIARREIHRNVVPEPSVDVRVSHAHRVRVSLGAWGPIDLALDGRARPTRGPDGSATNVSALFRSGKLEMRQVSSRGYRENWLTLSADGNYLFLQVRIGAPQLPDEIRYTLTYQRERTP